MPGRRRNPNLDRSIIEASRAVVAEVGYRRFSIERVAGEVGIPRSTIYARWPTTADLLDAALSGLLTMTSPTAATVRATLCRLLEDDLALASTPEGRALAHLLLAAQDPQGPAADNARSALLARRQLYRDQLAAFGVDPGTAERCADLALSVVWGRSVMLQDVPAPTAAELADDVLAVLDLGA